MYAIVKTGGKQYTVKAGDVLEVEKLAGEPGDKVELPVLFLNSDDAVITDADELAKIKVEAEIVDHHKGEKKLKFRMPPQHKGEAHMNAMRKYLLDTLLHTNRQIEWTYGYKTAMVRREHGIEKSHASDAFCIAGNFNAKRNNYNRYLHKFVRRHNRQLHKTTILKGGYRKANQAPKYVFGFRLFDGVRYHGRDCFVFGRRSSGSFDIRTLGGNKISAGVSYKRLKPLAKSTTILTERRTCDTFQP